jgi:glycosyltransferase involved in cell wall biosynthesis
MPDPEIQCFATQGAGSHDEKRITSLLHDLDPILLPFDRASKRHSALRLYARLRRDRPAVVVMEGTAISGGMAQIAARLTLGTRYVVSSGDAVSPFVGSVAPWIGPAAALYERLLYRCSAGFIGWTPYLVGRALTFGAPRAVTAPGWDPGGAPAARSATRSDLGIPEDAVVFGIVGSLAWNPRAGYCYGLELVRAIRRTARQDLRVLVVGGGDGLERLRAEAGDDPRVLLTGQVDRSELPSLLRCMDVGSLPQSVDGVGSFRYTTKISEYVAAGLPIVTGHIPAAYDLDDGWIWRLPGQAPWHDTYVDALASLMERLDPGEIAARARAVPDDPPEFDMLRQRRRVAAFVRELSER